MSDDMDEADVDRDFVRTIRVSICNEEDGVLEELFIPSTDDSSDEQQAKAIAVLIKANFKVDYEA